MGQYWRMRILSLLPSATEILYTLGLEDHLVGVTDECDWPPQAGTVQVVSHSALPAVADPAEIDRLVSASIGGGQPIYRLDTQAICELRPELVLAQDLCAVCAVPSGQVTQALDVLGGQAEVLSLDPSSLDEVLDGVWQVGKAAGVPEQAQEVVAGLRERLDRRPGRGRRAGTAPGVRPGVGRSAGQRRPLGARDAAGRRGRGGARLSGGPVAAGDLGAHRRCGAPGGGVHALRLRPPGGRQGGASDLAGAS